jgi:5'-methylthioadenosine phosphorylase
MSQKFAFIGGSGLYDLDGIKLIEELDIETPFGKPSSKVMKFSLEGKDFYFLARHGKGHFISPSDVNYRANIFALKKLGIDLVISVSAVGSLKEEHNPTKFVLPSQFIDWTKGQRKRSFFENGVVGHVSNAYPVNINLQSQIKKSFEGTDINHSVGGSYICIEGPQFSTRAESELYRSMNCDVIGMTNVPEAFLAKEAGMAYATIAMVTDYDCWKDEHCTTPEIMRVMGENNKNAQKLIGNIVTNLSETKVDFEKENQYSVVTAPDLISEKNKKIIEILLK